jgi:hypothetical protein
MVPERVVNRIMVVGIILSTMFLNSCEAYLTEGCFKCYHSGSSGTFVIYCNQADIDFLWRGGECYDYEGGECAICE